jgi:radical SAM superfamily enzyme YgiQ (UPF0313 family)
MEVKLISTNQENVPYPVMPIGMCLVGEATRKAGHHVEMYDMTFQKSQDCLPQWLEKPHNVVGISMRNLDNCDALFSTSYIPDVKKIITDMRRYSSAPIVLGGPAMGVAPHALLQEVGADYGIVGEGEVAFVKLLKHLEKGEDTSGVRGVISRKTKNIYQQVEGIDMKKNVWARIGDHFPLKPFLRGEGVYPLQSKRGCALKCVYCTYVNIEGQKYRLRSPDDLIDEIVDIRDRYGVHEFEFVDSTFNLPARYAIDICQEIARCQLNVSFFGSNINPIYLQPDLPEAMVKAGFRTVLCTAESASDRVLEGLSKGFKRQQIIKVARRFQQAGLRVFWMFLMGGPGEDQDTVEETLEFIHNEIGPKDVALVNSGIRIYPNTVMESIALEEGLIQQSDDLLWPVFYMSPGLEQEWLSNRINKAIKEDPRIFTSNQIQSSFIPLAQRALSWTKVKKPYWRFLPTINRIVNAYPN